MNSLKAISPIDGRYRKQVNQLENYFSEYALMKYRIKVEVEYLIALSNELPERLSLLHQDEIRDELRKLYEDFSTEDGQRVKEIESVTNHDVKAIEYFIKERLSDEKYAPVLEFVHFGLTSQDINNTAQPMMLRDALEDVWCQCWRRLLPNLLRRQMNGERYQCWLVLMGNLLLPQHLAKRFTYMFIVFLSN